MPTSNRSLSSFKTRTVRLRTIGISLVLVAFFNITFQLYTLDRYHAIVNEKINTKTYEALILYNTLLQKLFIIQQTTIKSALKTPGVYEAFKAGDREKLKTILYERYEVFSKNYPYLNVFHFIEPNNHSLLRLHRLDRFGDDLTNVRPMHVRANSEGKSLYGAEVGRYGISFRTVEPITYQGEHIGLLELGSPIETIMNELQQIINLDLLMVIKKEELQHSKLSTPQYYDDTYYMLFGSKLFNQIHPPLNHGDQFRYNNNPYRLVPALTLYSFDGEAIGQIYFAFDISREVEQTNSFIFINIILSLLLIVLLFFFLNFNLNRFIFQLKQTEHYSHLILNSQNNIVIVSNGKRLIDANRAFFDFFHFENIDDFLNVHNCINEFFVPLSGRPGYLGETGLHDESWIDQLIRQPQNEHKVLLRFKGRSYVFALQGKSTIINNERIFIVVFQDITRLEEQNIELQRIASTDALTRTVNRAKFDEIVQNEIHAFRTTYNPFSIIFFDIDHFKMVNDTYGHSRGDKVLISISALITRSIRQNDTFARWGGEEFIILLPSTRQHGATIIAEKFKELIASTHFEEVGHVTCSFGVTEFTVGDDTQSLLKRADEALYAAKKAGRNCVKVA